MTAHTQDFSVDQLPETVADCSSLHETVRYWKARAGATLLGAASSLPARSNTGLAIFNYHRVHPLAGLPLSVTPTALRHHLEGLLRAGYKPMTVVEYVNAIDAGQPVPRKRFAITFDDAFQNVHAHAVPVLQDLGVPATVYLATAYLDRDSFPFDPLVYQRSSTTNAEQCKPLTSDACEALLDIGWELAAHTHTHADFIGHPVDFVVDLERCLEVLNVRFGIESPTFSYPYGRHSEALREACRALRVRCALTTESELAIPESNRFAWGRFGAENYDTAATVVSKASGWYSEIRGLWRTVAYGRRRERALTNVAPVAEGVA